ncbi:MAG TPA: hypothetical protein VM942_09395 [Acidimicrobiales bacterium]|nr:hypothetical protein [Acidimicrobiales bacterium]
MSADPTIATTSVRNAVTPVTAPTRRLLLAGTMLVLAAGLSLTILTEQTDRFFAWTIASPLTAAFLGAGYLAAACLDGMSARERTWAVARVPLPAVLVFTTTTFIVTLVHIDAFHTDSFFGWAWIVTYALLPPSVLAVMVLQRRTAGGDPPRRAPLPAWVRVLTGVVGVALTVLGAALVFVPSEALAWWPWPLTVLTSRAVGAWLVIVGLTAGQAAWENDWTRLRPLSITYVVLGTLQLVALARYPDEVDWSTPASWLYLAVLAGLVVFGAAGWRAASRAPSAARV